MSIGFHKLIPLQIIHHNKIVLSIFVTVLTYDITAMSHPINIFSNSIINSEIGVLNCTYYFKTCNNHIFLILATQMR